jgi:hypothetical protein
LLDGYRGRPKADVDALVCAIVAFSRMTAQLGERLVEAEINPSSCCRLGRAFGRRTVRRCWARGRSRTCPCLTSRRLIGH